MTVQQPDLGSCVPSAISLEMLHPPCHPGVATLQRHHLQNYNLYFVLFTIVGYLSQLKSSIYDPTENSANFSASYLYLPCGNLREASVHRVGIVCTQKIMHSNCLFITVLLWCSVCRLLLTWLKTCEESSRMKICDTTLAPIYAACQ